MKNFQACSPLPGGLGAVCDDFLDSNQQILTPEKWAELQSKWVVTECVAGKTIGDMKITVEDACSEVTCDEQTQLVINGLSKIQKLGAPNESHPSSQ